MYLWSYGVYLKTDHLYYNDRTYNSLIGALQNARNQFFIKAKHSNVVRFIKFSCKEYFCWRFGVCGRLDFIASVVGIHARYVGNLF